MRKWNVVHRQIFFILLNHCVCIFIVTFHLVPWDTGFPISNSDINFLLKKCLKTNLNEMIKKIMLEMASGYEKKS